MYRPFIFCQMMITVDGKINGEFFNDPAYPPAIPVFRECFCTEGENRYPCQAGVFGKNTIQQNYTGYDMPDLDENAPLVPEVISGQMQALLTMLSGGFQYQIQEISTGRVTQSNMQEEHSQYSKLSLQTQATLTKLT